MSGWRNVIFKSEEDKRLAALEDKWGFVVRDKREVLARVWGFTRPHAWALGLSVALLFVLQVLAVVRPMLFRLIIDRAIPDRDLSLLNLLALGTMLIPLCERIVGALRERATTSFAHGLTQSLKYAIYSHYQRMGMRFYISTPKGEILARLDKDVDSAHGAISGTIVSTLGDIFRMVLAAAALISLDWQLAMIVLLVFPCFFIPARYWALHLRDDSYDSVLATRELMSFVAETLNVNGAYLSKLFGLQNSNRNQYAAKLEKVYQARNKHWLRDMLFWLFIASMSSSATAVVYWWGGRAVVEGRITAGTLFSFTAYLSDIYRPLTSVLNKWMGALKAIFSFERIFEVLDMEVEVKEVDFPVVLNKSDVRGEIVCDHVSFSYDAYEKQHPNRIKRAKRSYRDRGEVTSKGDIIPHYGMSSKGEASWALQDISFMVEAGKMCAVVGHSGAGKSTLTSLLLRLYDVCEGTLFIDGHDIRDLSLETISAIVGVVPQECVLLHDTLRNNLLLARPGATQEEVEQACQMANIYDMIQECPNGFDTIVGEDGYRLSGGEKQRVAIARAILKDPQILILDEATSSLDSISERYIQEAMRPLLGHRTSFVIAHRLSTILQADHILVLQRGRLVEQGTHQELLGKNGVYAELYHTQFKNRTKEATN